MHGIFITDWDHKGRGAILIGSFLGIHLYRFEPDGKWLRMKSPEAVRNRGRKAGRAMLQLDSSAESGF
jgi:hypothetical protein